LVVVFDEHFPHCPRHSFLNGPMTSRRAFAQSKIFKIRNLKCVAKMRIGYGEHFLDQREVPLGKPQPSGIYVGLRSLAEYSHLAMQEPFPIFVDVPQHFWKLHPKLGQEVLATEFHI
jgi:hypothetical protein